MIEKKNLNKFISFSTNMSIYLAKTHERFSKQEEKEDEIDQKILTTQTTAEV